MNICLQLQTLMRNPGMEGECTVGHGVSEPAPPLQLGWPRAQAVVLTENTCAAPQVADSVRVSCDLVQEASGIVPASQAFCGNQQMRCHVWQHRPLGTR